MGIIFAALLMILAIFCIARAIKLTKMTPQQRDDIFNKQFEEQAILQAKMMEKIKTKQEEKKALEKEQLKSLVNPEIMCPHCQTKGQVITMDLETKKGISGGKVTGAILTGGWSILATGLSRKEQNTHARCLNCNVKWTF